ncbi:MAG: PKD domain-containing protein [Cryomorphaceae bacterium]|nr:MAG: PKD domain-containing protein [Cryomorphaceae bacterium]
MKKAVLLFVLIVAQLSGFGQSQSQRVLFVGNSYTYYNNMPQIVANLALSLGDTLIHDSSTPPGYSFVQHVNNSNTLQKIGAGGWDCVVLQEQSQKPSFPMAQVEAEVLPYAAQLNNLILESSPCAQTVFYMTWGRKFGDAGNCPAWPPVCTYEGMDDLLYERYMLMAELNNAVVSPVGALWRYIIDNHPGIDLYDPDGSHPSESGSFAAACAFYAVLFRKNPATSSYNFILPPAMAETIRNAAETVVYNNLEQWSVGLFDVTSSFETSSTTVGPMEPVVFINLSTNANAYLWDFGDGNFSNDENPEHVYESAGMFNVQLTAYNDCDSALSSAQIYLIITSIAEIVSPNEILFYPNPSSGDVFINNNGPAIRRILLIDGWGRTSEITDNLVDGRPVSLSHLHPGAYFLQVYDVHGKVSTHKIIRTR